MRIAGFERGLASLGRLNAAAGDERRPSGVWVQNTPRTVYCAHMQSGMIERTPALPATSCHFGYTHRLS